MMMMSQRQREKEKERERERLHMSWQLWLCTEQNFPSQIMAIWQYDSVLLSYHLALWGLNALTSLFFPLHHPICSIFYTNTLFVKDRCCHRCHCENKVVGFSACVETKSILPKVLCLCNGLFWLCGAEYGSPLLISLGHVYQRYLENEAIPMKWEPRQNGSQWTRLV